jgi:hypothetical protein
VLRRLKEFVTTSPILKAKTMGEDLSQGAPIREVKYQRSPAALTRSTLPLSLKQT